MKPTVSRNLLLASVVLLLAILVMNGLLGSMISKHHGNVLDRLEQRMHRLEQSQQPKE